MTDSEGTPNDDPPDDPTAFQASMRQHKGLMEQMAGREHWEVDPLWLKVGRAIGIVVISRAAVARGATRIRINYEVGDEAATTLYTGVGFEPTTTTAMYINPA